MKIIQLTRAAERMLKLITVSHLAEILANNEFYLNYLAFKLGNWLLVLFIS